MVNGVGTISFGVLSEILSDVAQKTMVLNQRRNIMIEQMSLHYLRLIQLESELIFVQECLKLVGDQPN